MTYQVLARKWRPRTFKALVGQEHVLKALINALDHNRLHHAYLFTGTRGVGKTTIARILAKCLNCESGVSSQPCNQCGACTEINEGRFVDLIEVDAASRTKVEDTRELLDNVQYAPTRGRYKIYLIDEVHMLSNHSFNALLKTLEEPPEHVKFLLATTDPQKLPVTILSRCLQFNLKNMNPERIVDYLQEILGKEVVPFDEAALWPLARAADGSMRDALSLTDQAIAFGNGKIVAADVNDMLGTIDHQLIDQIVTALIAEDGESILRTVAGFAEHAPDYQAALADLLAVLHRIAIAQALPEALDNSYGDRSQILSYARQLRPEDVQLFYQTALVGRRDLPLASDARSGFEMTLLRMLVFKPQGVVDIPEQSLPTAQHSDELAGDSVAIKRVDELAPIASPAAQAPVTEEGTPAKKPLTEPANTAPVPVSVTDHTEESSASIGNDYSSNIETVDLVVPDSARVPTANLTENNLAQNSLPTQNPSVSLAEFSPEHWLQVYRALDIKGILQNTAANCIFVRKEDAHLYFILDINKGSLFEENHQQRLSELLEKYFQQSVKVHIEKRKLVNGEETPAELLERHRREQQEAAIATLKNDPFVQELQREFSASLQEESVTVTDNSMRCI